MDDVKQTLAEREGLEKLYSAKEVAEYFDVSAATITKMVKQGDHLSMVELLPT